MEKTVFWVWTGVTEHKEAKRRKIHPRQKKKLRRDELACSQADVSIMKINKGKTGVLDQPRCMGGSMIMIGILAT